MPEWTQERISLFHQFKADITSSPCLARYDSNKPCFIKTDWSATGMGFILMQPDDSEASKEALVHLTDQADADFDATSNGARLRPILFGSRHCSTKERHFHSFVGEAACGRWAIGQMRKYLWGTHFYWITDCIALHEFLEYDGPIHQVKQWTQELLGYFFTVIHHPAHMLKDIDAISHLYDPLIIHYNQMAFNLLQATKTEFPNAFTSMPIDALTRSLAPPNDLTPPTPAHHAILCKTLTNMPPRLCHTTLIPLTS